jgi:hypothetical protein
VLNVAVWLGTIFFLIFGAEPALFSTETQGLLQKSHPYLAGLIVQVLRRHSFYLSVVCGCGALVLLAAERLYLGRPARKSSLTLLVTLLILVLWNGWWLQPRLKENHVTRLTGSNPAQRQAAQHFYGTWETVAYGIDLVLIAGLTVYLWFVAHPPDSTRFLSAGKIPELTKR